MRVYEDMRVCARTCTSPLSHHVGPTRYGPHASPTSSVSAEAPGVLVHHVPEGTFRTLVATRAMTASPRQLTKNRSSFCHGRWPTACHARNRILHLATKLRRKRRRAFLRCRKWYSGAGVLWGTKAPLLSFEVRQHTQFTCVYEMRIDSPLPSCSSPRTQFSRTNDKTSDRAPGQVQGNIVGQEKGKWK